jgi:ABC-2 type transport system ATP-binding protein
MHATFLDLRDVRKNFGPAEALRGVSFGVNAGELFGLLGPNGAGKSTLLSIVACLADPSAGEVIFDGRPLRRSDLSVRRRIGIATQDIALYGELTARENLNFFGRLYGLRGTDLARRVGEVLELAGLTDRADQRVSTFSGGMKRRLNLGVAVVHGPELLLLDEPTAGVDPQSRNHIFERVRALNAAGLTVVYTSHYMEEVQALCPRIAILDHGRLIACDTRDNLLRLLEGTVRLTVAGDPAAARAALAHLPGVRVAATDGNTITLATRDVSGTVLQAVRVLRELGADLDGLETNEPSLERVFLHLTEKALRD